ncbi:MAG: serine/threonine protein kinase [Chlamydiales bacterium]|jgi:serine/threonine-protein kinase|nr:serine/threonine protein kinase [Chlamydiales bacterium]
MNHYLVVKGYQTGPRIDQVGFKTLYRSLHLASQREYLITLVACKPGPSQKGLIRRAELSQKIEHPRLVAATDYGTLPDGRFYYTHPAVPSFPLERIIKDIADQEERWQQSIRFFLQFLEALDYIHRAKATHRDLNLSHLRVNLQDELLVEGFINARPKVEPSSMIHLVHLPYLAPEQLVGHAADAKTDLYAAGVMLFELLTGKRPYTSNYAKIDDAKRGMAPNPCDIQPDLPKHLAMPLVKALSVRKHRYASAQEMREDLKLYAQRRPFREKLRDFSDNLMQLLFLK